ncbi:MAG: S10 family peptidase [Gammaproteobacteria bacterium]
MPKLSSVVAVSFALALCAAPAFAADTTNNQAAEAQPTPPVPAPKSEQSVTTGSVTVDGHTIPYKAIAGIMVVKDAKGKPYTSMSYFAYLKSGVRDESTRPLTFFYNGGPGYSTAWLHMLAWGPKLAVVGNGTLTPPPPYQLENNGDSLLDATDEVFIDMPGTGFGRVLGKDKGGVGTPAEVFGVDQDALTFTRFITQYLTEHSRWNSPHFLYGESYGTTRDAVLSYDLEQADVGLNGVVFQSSILNFNISADGPQSDPGINIPYALSLPTYAATAWYHHKLANAPAELQPFLKQVEAFAMGPYLAALNEGSELSSSDEAQIAEQVHNYTGLPVDYIVRADLRISGPEFTHELLSSAGDVTGRYDTRFTGPAMNPMGQGTQYDPTDASVDTPLISLLNNYLRDTLHFGANLTYRPTLYAYYPDFHWDMKHRQPGSRGGFEQSGTLNVMPDIAAAMKRDPDLKVLLLNGYMDLATPFYGALYEMRQLPIPQKLDGNISYDFYPSGHMIYVNPKVHQEMHATVAKFITDNSQGG